jgi:hypothetical protein
MGWVNTGSYAHKFIDLFAENRLFPEEWKFMIPLHIVQQPLAIVANAKNFADGIQYNIELHGVEIPDELLAYEGMGQNNEYLQVIADMANRYVDKVKE